MKIGARQVAAVQPARAAEGSEAAATPPEQQIPFVPGTSKRFANPFSQRLIAGGTYNNPLSMWSQYPTLSLKWVVYIVIAAAIVVTLVRIVQHVSHVAGAALII
jgi:hypothetical protein